MISKRLVNRRRILVALAAAAILIALPAQRGSAGEDEEKEEEAPPAPQVQPELALPLWPYPHTVRPGEGTCDLAGKAIFLPAGANEKSQTVAAALAAGLQQYLKLPAAPAVRKEGASDRPYVLSIGVGPEAWPAAAEKLKLGEVLPTLQPQAYLLEITPQGAVIVSPGSWGLFYGAVTLMQLARCSGEGTKIPCATILDWPDMEVRGIHVTSAPVPHRLLAGVYSLDGKANMLVWENHMTSFAWEVHPELGGRPGPSNASAPAFAKSVRDVRRMGVEVVPLRNMAVGHCKQSGLYPYVFMGDNETYFWAMREIMDTELEAYTPRYFHLGLDEEQGSFKDYLYPTRTLRQWRTVAVECTRHLRRRGVMGMMWSEILFPQWGGRSSHFDWKGETGKEFPGGYAEFTDVFPRDLVLVAWYYWAKTPQETLDGKGDLRRQASTGMPVLVGAYQTGVINHSGAVKIINAERPNVLGVLTTSWGGRSMYQSKYPRHPEYVRHASGPFWNLDVPGIWPPEGKSPDPNPFWENKSPGIDKFKWPPAELSMPDLQCLFDADAPASVADALAKIREADWRTWTDAREQLVAAGLAAAPEVLAAMSKADGEVRERIEGCLSRNARDSRTGRRRGTLDVSKVLPFLRDPEATVRDMAAELIASCADGGAAQLRGTVADPVAGAACCRALGVVRDADAAGALVGVLGAGGASPEAVAEAARALGLLKAKQAAEPLRGVLRSAKNGEVQRAALWALALLGCREADAEIAPLLASEDRDLRFRAAVALTLLGSPETKRLVPWLLEDRQSLEVAAWSMWKSWKADEAKAAFTDAAKQHKDETCRKRLDMLAKMVAGGEAGRY